MTQELDQIEELEEASDAAYEPLRWLTDVYNQVQKLRISLGNRRLAYEQGRDSHVPPPRMTRWEESLVEMETSIKREMDYVIKDHPAWPWLAGVRGIGPTLATKMLGLIGDVGKFPTVSKLWRFAGYAVIEGSREYHKKGEKAHYSTRLKTVLYLVGDSFIKSNSPYRAIYDGAKEHYHSTHPEWTKGHVHLASKRKMVKLFLSHLWEVWRIAEGHSVRPPYVQEYLGHTTISDPWQFNKA